MRAAAFEAPPEIEVMALRHPRAGSDNAACSATHPTRLKRSLG